MAATVDVVALSNPNGINNFDHFGTEAAYGAVKKLTDLKQSAPMAGTRPASPAPARRGTKQATAVSTSDGGGPLPGSPPPPHFYAAQFWAAAAADPEASDHVRALAKLAGG